MIPWALIISFKSFWSVSKIREHIRYERCTAGVVDTSNKATTGVDWHRRQIYRWCGEHIFPKIYTDRGDIGSKFANGVVDTGNNLLMVHVNNASGKFATGAMTIAVDSCNNIRLPSP